MAPAAATTATTHEQYVATAGTATVPAAATTTTATIRSMSTYHSNNPPKITTTATAGVTRQKKETMATEHEQYEQYHQTGKKDAVATGAIAIVATGAIAIVATGTIAAAATKHLHQQELQQYYIYSNSSSSNSSSNNSNIGHEAQPRVMGKKKRFQRSSGGERPNFALASSIARSPSLGRSR